MVKAANALMVMEWDILMQRVIHMEQVTVKEANALMVMVWDMLMQEVIHMEQVMVKVVNARTAMEWDMGHPHGAGHGHGGQCPHHGAKKETVDND